MSWRIVASSAIFLRPASETAGGITNPARGCWAGRIPARDRHRYLTATEVVALSAACGDQGDIVTILAYAGLRWSELVGLRVGDVDLPARRHTHWARALKKTNLAALTIHELRHTYASLARAFSADLRYVQKTMGHSTPTVTANIYSGLYSDELDRVAANLDWLHSSDATRANGQEPDTPKPFIECHHSVRAAQTRWPGPGSNRRPSAFQADAHTD